MYKLRGFYENFIISIADNDNKNCRYSQSVVILDKVYNIITLTVHNLTVD